MQLAHKWQLFERERRRGMGVILYNHSSYLVHLVSLAEPNGLLETSVFLVHVRRDASELEQLVLLDPLRERHLREGVT